MPRGVTSTSIKWLSVPPLTSLRPPASSASARAFALSMIWRPYVLNSGRRASREANRFAGDDVHQRPALDAREHAAVDRFAVFFFRQAQTGARAAQCFVRGGGHEIGDRHGAVVQAGGDETGVVGHIDHQLRADAARDFGELVVRNLARISARAGDDHLWLVLASERGDLIEVEAIRIARYAVADEVVQHAADVQLHAVRQVAAVGQVEAEDGVAGFERRQVDGGVGLRAAVRLNVGEFGPEQLLGTIDRELLDDIDEFAAAVVPPAWIAFGILIREHAAGRLHYGGAGVVFAGDHFETIGLALDFVLDRVPKPRDHFFR